MVQDPPQIEQKQIAEILSSLDETKIELNRKINANLGKLASTLFKKWFVDIGDKLPEGWRMELMGTGYAATRTSASSTDNASDSAAEVSLLEKTAHSREWAFFFFMLHYSSQLITLINQNHVVQPLFNVRSASLEPVRLGHIWLNLSFNRGAVAPLYYRSKGLRSLARGKARADLVVRRSAHL